MGQILVRNLDDDVIEDLKAKALERGTSLEQVAREALTDAARRKDRLAWVAELDALRAQARLPPGWNGTEEIRAARDALAARLDRPGTTP
jgi:plasmid stability protein